MPGYRGKRALDLVLVGITSPAWLIALALTAVATRVMLGQPVVFRQKRPGHDGRLFELLKFRTMTNTRDASGNLLPDAQRMTAFGRWLRATSLDELPELINVLRGDMSLVGPRPLLIEYLPLYSIRHRRRHEVRPGITGLAQVSGRNAIGWDEKLDLDVVYVDSASLPLDLRIMWRTLAAVVRRTGISSPGEETAARFTGYGTITQQEPDEPTR